MESNHEIEIRCSGTECIAIERLTPFQGGLKTLSKENYEKLKKEILELGFSEPVSVWKNEDKLFILNGHQRVNTLLKMREDGFKIPDLPVNYVEARDLKEAKKKILALTSQYGSMESQGLYEFMNESGLTIDEVSESFRFPEIDFDSFRQEFFEDPARIGNVDEDDIPCAPQESSIKPGDLFILGDHRLLCGDSRSLEQVEKLMAGSKADMVFTDPPYNVDYEGKTEDALKIQNDKMTDGDFRQFLQEVFANYFVISKPGSAIYICHADSNGLTFRSALIDAGWLLKQCLIWVKQHFVMGRQDYHWQHEPILYGWSSGGSHRWFGDRKQSTVWQFERPMKSTDHPTMKPVELIQHALSNSSEKGDLVVDLFGGSGSTLIACEKTGRRCNTMELDPKYCEVIIQRWETYAGKRATKSTGQ